MSPTKSSQVVLHLEQLPFKLEAGCHGDHGDHGELGLHMNTSQLRIKNVTFTVITQNLIKYMR